VFVSVSCVCVGVCVCVCVVWGVRKSHLVGVSCVYVVCGCVFVSVLGERVCVLCVGVCLCPCLGRECV